MGSSCFLETLLRQSLLSKMSSLLKFEEKWKINEEISNQMNNLQFSWPSYLPGCNKVILGCNKVIFFVKDWSPLIRKSESVVDWMYRTPKENPISGIVLFRFLLEIWWTLSKTRLKKLNVPSILQFNSM